VIERVRNAVPEIFEIIVVDDGSADETGPLAEAAGAQVIRLDPNRGKGVALRTGVEAATGEVVAFIDADGQDDPEEMPGLLNTLTADPTIDMVIGSRFAGVLEEGSITRLNHFGNRALTWLFNRLYGCRLTDTQAGFRAVRRKALRLEELRAVRYEIETELTLHVLRHGGRVVEVPVTRSPRRGGSTGFVVVRDGLRILSTMTLRRLGSARRSAGGTR
jgi:glycosyltransferase involved in cell wall biosynthesis